MPSADYRVTVVFDYTAEWDEVKGDEESWKPDEDFLHDAIVDSYDTIDLEFTTEHPLYDENGDEKVEMHPVTLNADNIREVEITELDR